MNYRCWIGKPEHFASEVQKLLPLLEEVMSHESAIILSAEERQDFDWICGEYRPHPPNSGPGMVGLLTSGTTGAPKTYLKNLVRLYNAKKGHGKPSDKWLLTYNPARWAGLSVILHTLRTNAQLVLPDTLSPAGLLDKIPLATHVSLTPSLFRKLLITGPNQLQAAPIEQVTFGGEYATQKVLDDAKNLWPKAKVTHIYAATELGDVCACSDGFEGLPIDKIKVNFSLLNTGELIVGGINTGDLWNLSNNRLYFLGRVSETINVGGAKVTQSTVENAALQIVGIDECKAYAIDNALLGQVVGLDYVGNAEPLDIKRSLLNVLPKYAVPVKINKVDSITLTSAGKKARA